MQLKPFPFKMISLWKAAIVGILLAALVPLLGPSILPAEWLEYLPSTSALDLSVVASWLSSSLITLEPLLVKVLGKETLGWLQETAATASGGRMRRAPFPLADIVLPPPPPPPTTTLVGCAANQAPAVKTIYAIGGHSFVDYNINQTQWGWEIGPLSQNCRPRIYDLYQDCKRVSFGGGVRSWIHLPSILYVIPPRRMHSDKNSTARMLVK